ncbi:MAG: peptidoglycan editing factor PgeF [Planctomycetota bacterium]
MALVASPSLVRARPSRLGFHARVEAVFYGRLGGVSTGAYASLNTGIAVGDDVSLVMQNRDIVGSDCEPGLELASVRQVHGASVALGRDARAQRGECEADALVTSCPRLALVINTADCAPLYLQGPDAAAIALAHCGWRGIVSGVVEATVAALLGSCGREAAPERLLAFIGPCIHRCCYAVGEELVRAFPPSDAGAFRRRPRLTLDLTALIRRRLAALGVPPDQIEAHGDCTCCRSDLYFSHRQDRGSTGRNAAVMFLSSAHAVPASAT